jgi:hypothetical protein
VSNGKDSSTRKEALVFALAALLITGAVLGWWFLAERPRREAARKALQEEESERRCWSQLRLVRVIKQPFRILFNAYDGDPKKPESLEFQINVVDVNEPSQFVKIGDIIAQTKFKVIKFEEKIASPRGSAGDFSELTLTNTETGKEVVLTLGRITDTPDSYALLCYLWDNTEFMVKKGAEFVLPPDITLKYRLIDVTESEASIKTPSGQEVTVPSLNH